MDIKDIFPEGLDLNTAYDLLEPLGIFILGMSLYAIFIFNFYRFVSTRNVFSLNYTKPEETNHHTARTFFNLVLYVGKYIFVFPVVAFIWFCAFTILLSFLTPSRDFSDILLVAMAVVATIRVSAYVTEDLSRDLAKILPFAVLGIFIIDLSFFESSDSFEALRQANNNRESILYYLGFLIILEFALRIANLVLQDARSLLKGEREPIRPSSPTSPVLPEPAEAEGATP
ncbi:MAG: hypothetical protein O2913_08010 [Chloroflexi bacterium]|nr:hypothetical protein [Chloroflexota bacterium]